MTTPIHILDNAAFNALSKLNNEQYQELLYFEIRKAREMLGDSISVRLASQVIDASTGQNIASQSLGRVIEISLQAKDPIMSLNHEVWHYAHDHLIGPKDRARIERAFADGSRLNTRVRELLVRNQASKQALEQCENPRFAAAHGFAFWVNGQLGLTLEQAHKKEYVGNTGLDRTVGRVFRAVEGAFINLGKWVTRLVGQTEQSKNAHSAQHVFRLLRSGALADNNPHTLIQNQKERLNESRPSPFNPRTNERLRGV